ncbi:DUF1415 domain-containing protein [Shewanella litorisediminis]|uniref:DUF1415 domain-containing protein n=1 Tax=Shewanella litorisediminis TaxID=1173586 RepID=A0ABX7G719_9GAMM|nr:DUF1415 domain-containing protein [Shewanella litorisediminis]MCL2916714.1 DUF1415 domain-containing protein [Shewanella litorisediminis]QRH03115.1 DUF1415 domain-containing protein [Shewanella litorisediminis]
MSEQQEIQAIADETRAWVNKVIMKYNICPFTRREVERNSIRYTVCQETRMELVLQALLDECQFLDAHPEVETSLFILPRGFEGFYLYLDLLGIAEDLLVEEGFEGTYQLASFHPDYCFHGEPQDDPANFTNRAPYPTLHIIREEGMAAALASYNEPESIPERNIAFARRKGSEFFVRLLQECKKPD